MSSKKEDKCRVVVTVDPTYKKHEFRHTGCDAYFIDSSGILHIFEEGQEDRKAINARASYVGGYWKSVHVQKD